MALAAKSIEEIKEAFDTFDVDKSGSISSSEVKNVLKKLGFDSSLKDVNDMMAEFDRNHDGSISFAEFAKTVGGRFYVERSHSEIAEKIRQFDVDNSGYLSHSEISAAMRHFRGNYSDAEISKLIRHVDRNNDGKVSVLEFIDLLASTAK